MVLTQMKLAIRHNYRVDVESIEFELERGTWWVRTVENLRVPHRFPWVVVKSVGSGPSLEVAMYNAAREHLSAVEICKRQEGLT